MSFQIKTFSSSFSLDKPFFFIGTTDENYWEDVRVRIGEEDGCRLSWQTNPKRPEQIGFVSSVRERPYEQSTCTHSNNAHNQQILPVHVELLSHLHRLAETIDEEKQLSHQWTVGTATLFSTLLEKCSMNRKYRRMKTSAQHSANVNIVGTMFDDGIDARQTNQTIFIHRNCLPPRDESNATQTLNRTLCCWQMFRSVLLMAVWRKGKFIGTKRRTDIGHNGKPCKVKCNYIYLNGRAKTHKTRWICAFDLSPFDAHVQPDTESKPIQKWNRLSSTFVSRRLTLREKVKRSVSKCMRVLSDLAKDLQVLPWIRKKARSVKHRC